METRILPNLPRQRRKWTYRGISRSFPTAGGNSRSRSPALKAVRDGCGEALCRSRSVMPETEYDRINALAMEYIGDVLIENGGILEDYLSDIQPILDKCAI